MFIGRPEKPCWLAKLQPPGSKGLFFFFSPAYLGQVEVKSWGVGSSETFLPFFLSTAPQWSCGTLHHVAAGVVCLRQRHCPSILSFPPPLTRLPGRLEQTVDGYGVRVFLWCRKPKCLTQRPTGRAADGLDFADDGRRVCPTRRVRQQRRGAGGCNKVAAWFGLVPLAEPRGKGPAKTNSGADRLTSRPRRPSVRLAVPG